MPCAARRQFCSWCKHLTTYQNIAEPGEPWHLCPNIFKKEQHSLEEGLQPTEETHP